MSLAHAIMAALIDCPGSGYDLAKQFDGSVGFFWQASHQQIYRELAKLEARGWVSYETIPQAGRPDKKRYCITQVGQKQLIDWLTQPSELTTSKEEILVKIFAGHHAPQKDLIAELQRHRQAHLERLGIYQANAQQYFPDPQNLSFKETFQYLALSRGISSETSWITWCDQAIALLSRNLA